MALGRVTIRVKADAVGSLAEGIGFNWNDALGMGGDTGAGQKDYSLETPTYPLLEDDEHWKLLLHDMSCVKPGWIRFLLPPEGIITKRGTIDTDSPHFERLSRIHAWAQAAGASIMLDLVMAPPHLQMKGADLPDGWARGNNAPKDVDAYSRTFVRPVVSFLLEELEMEQVRYLNLVNEPLAGGVFQSPGDDEYARYVAAYRTVRRDLVQRGFVPQRLQMAGPDTNSPTHWPIPDFHARGLDLDPYVDAYDEHCYVARFDWQAPSGNAQTIPMSLLVSQFLGPHAAYARRRGKPFFLTEIGTFHYGWRYGDRFGPSTHEAFVLEAELVVRGIAAGTNGFLRYCFLNPGDIDGVWQFVDTADGSYRRRENTFYGYANLCRYARQNSEVLAAETEVPPGPYAFVHACALRKPGGEFTLLVVNDHDSETAEVDVRLPGAFAGRKLRRIFTSRTSKHEAGPEFVLRAKSPGFSDVLPPMCLAAYTDIPYEELQR